SSLSQQRQNNSTTKTDHHTTIRCDGHNAYCTNTHHSPPTPPPPPPPGTSTRPRTPVRVPDCPGHYPDLKHQPHHPPPTRITRTTRQRRDTRATSQPPPKRMVEPDPSGPNSVPRPSPTNHPSRFHTPTHQRCARAVLRTNHQQVQAIHRRFH